MAEAVVLGPGEGEKLLVRNGSELIFRAVTVSGAGSFVLVLHAPALDGYFRELADLWVAPDPPERDVELDLMRRHGMEPV